MNVDEEEILKQLHDKGYKIDLVDFSGNEYWYHLYHIADFITNEITISFIEGWAISQINLIGEIHYVRATCNTDEMYQGKCVVLLFSTRNLLNLDVIQEKVRE